MTILRENYRASDETVYSVLDRIGCGNVAATPGTMELLSSRLFVFPGGPDPNGKEWRTAVLITTGNKRVVMLHH